MFSLRNKHHISFCVLCTFHETACILEKNGVEFILSRVERTYAEVRKSQVNQNLFMTSLPSIRKLLLVVSNHGCKGILETKKITRRGHVHTLKLTWGDRGKRTYIWAPSPYLQNWKYLVNE